MWGTIIVAGILVVIVAAILFGMRKDRKSGKGSCGGDCSKCKGCHSLIKAIELDGVYYDLN